MAARVAALLALAALATPGVGRAATPAACASAQSRATVTAFIQAFNRGNIVQLDRLFAAWPEFQWYSSGAPGQRFRTAAGTRSTLMAYFAARHRARDRFRLVKFDYNGDSGPYSNFALVLRRSASGYRNGAWFDIVGKGSIACRVQPGKLMVLSLSGPDPGKP